MLHIRNQISAAFTRTHFHSSAFHFKISVKSPEYLPHILGKSENVFECIFVTRVFTMTCFFFFFKNCMHLTDREKIVDLVDFDNNITTMVLHSFQ